MRDIPVFVSLPSKLNPRQGAVHASVEKSLTRLRLISKTVGRSDRPLKSPIGEVYQLARRCAGGLIIGFRQIAVPSCTFWPDTEWTEQGSPNSHFPTPWNQLEAGMLYSLGVPMLIFAEKGVTGGIFEKGMSNFFIHPFVCETFTEQDGEQMHEIISDWSRHVQNHYMDDDNTYRG
jgi:hypothetical protein